MLERRRLPPWETAVCWKPLLCWDSENGGVILVLCWSSPFCYPVRGLTRRRDTHQDGHPARPCAACPQAAVFTGGTWRVCE